MREGGREGVREGGREGRREGGREEEIERAKARARQNAGQTNARTNKTKYVRETAFQRGREGEIEKENGKNQKRGIRERKGKVFVRVCLKEKEYHPLN